ncbi:unnamed protein product [Litomosoides sigmodontis]|uniref:Apple domain-containing protein n=1 Tax=Litomosoides sigmodontis TaxID=42156 RepID=A0A3P6SHG7_LITSI|nr:unnamed protein product [Litomosoides sigmodontis]
MNWKVLFDASILYLTTVIGAAPNRSNKPECPDNQLRVHVNVTESGRGEYHLISRVGANSLLQCTQKCYEDPRCFSLKYLEVDRLSCTLTSFAPESCLNVISIPVDKIKYDINTLITITCIKCKLTKQHEREELFTSSETSDSDESSQLLSGKSVSGASLQPSSTLRSAGASNSGIGAQRSSPMRCHQDIRFVAEQSTDLAAFGFFEGAVVANSVRECAEKCFENCCKVALYSSANKKCQLAKGSKSENGGSCKTKPLSSYVNQRTESDWIKITCVTCGSLPSRTTSRDCLSTGDNSFDRLKLTVRLENNFEDDSSGLIQVEKEGAILLKERSKSGQVGRVPLSDEVLHSSGTEQPVIASALDRFASPKSKRQSRIDPQFMKIACIVVFEVDPNANIANFKAEDSVEVDRADHCAYLCYRDACTAAIFTPATTAGRKGTCQRQFDIAEKCNSGLKRDYYYKTNKPVYLQCFRCLPEKPNTKSLLKSIARQWEISSTTSKKHSFETTPLNIAEANEELMGITMSPEITGKSKEVAEDIVPLGATQPKATTFVQTGFRSREQTQPFTENITAASDEASETALLTNNGNVEVTVEPSENVPVTENEFQTKMSVSISPNNLAAENKTEFPRESESIDTGGSRTQSPEFTRQSTIKSKGLNSLHKSRAEEEGVNDDILSFGSETEAEFHRTETAGVDDASREAITASTTRTASEHEKEMGESNTIAPSFATAGIVKFNDINENPKTIITDGSVVEAKSKKERNLSEAGQSVSKGAGASQTYLKGCLVTFQVDPYSKSSSGSLAGQQSLIIARSSEVCAGKCYQNGCTGAKYDPSSKHCTLDYAGKQICNNGPDHFFYEANETIWIHCTRCKLHKPGDQGFNIRIHSPEAETKGSSVSNTATSISAEQEIKSVRLDGIKETGAGVLPEKSMSEVGKGAEHTIEGILPETLTSPTQPASSSSSVEKIEVSTTATVAGELTTEREEGMSKEKLSNDFSARSATVEKIDGSVATVPFQTSVFGHDCTLSFQVKPIDAHFKVPNTEFIPAGATLTVEDCAKRCSTDGCTGAKFDPINKECLLTFGDHHQCDENEQQHQSLKANGPLWIHCISCKKVFTESTLGLLDHDAATLPVMDEQLKEEEHSAIDQSPSTLERARTEEMFYTGSSHDFITETTTNQADTRGTTSSGAGTGKKSQETDSIEESDTKTQPDISVSLTPQTPISAPTDSSGLLSASGKTSGSSNEVEESTETNKFESGEQKGEKEGTEFQKGDELTSTSSDITSASLSSSELSDDVVGAIADIVSNLSNSIPKAGVEETTDLSEASGRGSEEIISPHTSETSIAESHAKAIEETLRGIVTSSTIDEAEPTAKTPSGTTSTAEETNVPMDGERNKSEKENHASTDESSSTLKLEKTGKMLQMSLGQDLSLKRAENTESEFTTSNAIGSKSADVASEPSVSNATGSEKAPFATESCHHENEAICQMQAIGEKIKSEKVLDMESPDSVEPLEIETSYSGTDTARTTAGGAKIGGVSFGGTDAGGTISSGAGVGEESMKTGGNEGVDITIQPDVSVSLTPQTPLSLPTDSSRILNVGGGRGISKSSNVVEESTDANEVKPGEQKDERKSTEFQKEAKLTSTSSDITSASLSSSEMTGDVVGAAADIAPNTSSSIPKAGVKETTDLSETSGRENDEIMSSHTSETSIAESDVKAIEEALRRIVVDEALLAGSDAEKSDTKAAKTTNGITSATEGTTTAISNEENISDKHSTTNESSLTLEPTGTEEMFRTSSRQDLGLKPTEVIELEFTTESDVMGSRSANVASESSSVSTTNKNESVLFAITSCLEDETLCETQAEVGETTSDGAVTGGTISSGTSTQGTISSGAEIGEATSGEVDTGGTISSRAGEMTAGGVKIAGASSGGVGSGGTISSGSGGTTDGGTGTGGTISSGTGAGEVTVNGAEIVFGGDDIGETTSGGVETGQTISSGTGGKTAGGTNTGETVSSGTGVGEESVKTGDEASLAGSDAGIFKKKDISDSEAAKTASGITSTVKTTASMGSEENTQETSAILKKVVSLSEIVSNLITEEPFVQENVDSVIKKVAQSKDIVVADTGPSVADASVEKVAAEKLREEDGEDTTDEGASDVADALVDEGKLMTTEPPVQAVSDLISVLSENSNIVEVIGRREDQNDALIADDLLAEKEQGTSGDAANELHESPKRPLRNIVKIKPFQGPSTECFGRIEFEIFEVEDLSQLNVTNEITVESPAACARKCYDTANCVLAAYKQSASDESTSAVCVLTSNQAACTVQAKPVPQYKSHLSQFIISCLKCTKCHYTISAVTELTRISQAEAVESALSIGQCGERCWEHKCAVAQYDDKSNLVRVSQLTFKI